MKSNTNTDFPGQIAEFTGSSDEPVRWLEQALPRIMRRLMDSENLDMPLLQLPLAQLRLAQALYKEQRSDHIVEGSETDTGDTMGQLSDRLGVRHNALTQAADRLINHGLAERTSDPRDRRVVRLRLTEKGRTWVQARRERRRAHLAALWSQLNTDERAQFVQAVRTLEAIGHRLEPAAPAQQPTALIPSMQTVEETLMRFVAGADTTLSKPIAAIDAETTVATTHISEGTQAILSHAISRKEDE